MLVDFINSSLRPVKCNGAPVLGYRNTVGNTLLHQLIVNLILEEA